MLHKAASIMITIRRKVELAWEAAAVQDWRQLEVAVAVTGGQAQSQKGLPSR
jgi:hypothetical protein